MKIQRFKPSKGIRDWVKFILYIKADVREAKLGFGYAQPCNLEGLQLYLSKPSRSSLTNFKRRLPRYCVASMLTEPVYLDIEEPLEVVLVMFQKVRCAHLFKTPMSCFMDHQMDLADMYPILIKDFEENFRDDIPLQQKIDAVNKLLESMVDKRTFNKTIMNYLVEKIYEKSGNIKVKDLKECANTSYKTIENKFKRSVGMPPKMYIDIIRANHTMQCLQTFSTYQGHKILESSGYYDESHLIKNFKKYFDLTPQQMFKKLNDPNWFQQEEFTSQIIDP